MAETLIPGAVTPQDEGFPDLVDGEDESYNSAALVAAMGQAIDSDSYVRSANELTFTNHDGSNDTVDVTAGLAYLKLDGESIDVQSGTGSDNSTPSYDTTLPTVPVIPVIVPSNVTGVALQNNTLSSVWLAYDTDGTGPGGSAGDVYLRSDDTGSESAPSHPSVELGEANPDDSSADVLKNRGASPSLDEPDIGNATGESLYTDELGSKSEPVSYHIKTDGETITAVPQEDESDGITFSRVTGNDIGQVLESVIIDELPPQGSEREATGKVLFQRAEYPGRLSNGAHDGVPLAAALKLEGETQPHYDFTGDRGATPQNTKGSILRTDSIAFYQPDVTNDKGQVQYPELRNLHIVGAGSPEHTSTESYLLDSRNSTDMWDWLFVTECVFQDFHYVDLRNSHKVVFTRNQFLGFKTIWDAPDRSTWRDNGFYMRDETVGSTFVVPSGVESVKYETTGGTEVFDASHVITGNFFYNAQNGTAASPAVAQLQVKGQNAVIHGNISNNLGNIGGIFASIVGTDTHDDGTDAQGVYLTGNIGKSQADANSYDQFIFWKPEGEGNICAFNQDRTTRTASSFYVGNGKQATNDQIYGNHFPNGVTINTSGTRTRWNGTVLLNGAPDSTNYDSGDVGTQILDTSMSPPTEYVVDTDGSLLGPL